MKSRQMIGVCQRLHTTVYLEEGLIELKSNSEQRHKSMARPGIGIDWPVNRLIEGAWRRPGMSLVPKALSRPRSPNRCTCAAAPCGPPAVCAGVVALDTLHTHRAVPSGAQDLRYPARVVPADRAALSATGDRSSASIP